MIKYLLSLLALLLLISPVEAQLQTNVISGNVGDYGVGVVSGVQVMLTLLKPNPRIIGNTLIRKDPEQVTTGSDGSFAFTNIQWGFYRLDVSGVGTSFTANIYTNTLGNVGWGALITNSATLPPNPASNYYTAAQIDALSAAASFILNNLVAGANVFFTTNVVGGVTQLTISSLGGGGGSQTPWVGNVNFNNFSGTNGGTISANNLIGGGANQVLEGAGVPSSNPAFPSYPATYINRTTGAIYWWNTSNNTWN